jgi:lipopolysaccharide/colanic/teichoic acid biosynthesis glycosyltransferase
LFGPLLVVLALSKVHAAWVADPPYDYTGSFRFGWSLAYAAVLALAAYGVGLPDVPVTSRTAAAQTLVASLVASLAVSAVQLVVGDSLLPRFVVFGAAIGVVPVHVLAWRISRHGRHRDEGRDRLVVVAAPADVEQLVVDLGMSPERPAVVVGHLLPGEPVETAPTGSTDSGSTRFVDRPLLAAVVAGRASVLVLDRAAMLDPQIIEEASSLHEAGIRVRSLVELYEGWLGKLPVTELERASLFFDISELHGVRYSRLKRLVDVACAAVGLVVLLLATPVILLGNLVANRGPLLYRQERVGRGGMPFEILKFRTMRPGDPEVVDTSWTTEHDPRVTGFGRLLRRSHLDELPQVLNILRGDLSIVGPRPEQPRYVRELSAKLPFYGMRHLVRPGLTGWAQVKYGYAGDERDAVEKLQYEFFYLRRQSLRFDLRVMGRTVRSVLGGEGRGR